jgi:hypothetical protein
VHPYAAAAPSRLIDLRGWVRYYFYFRKLMGYVLGSFIVAGLSGLTK